MLNYLLVSSLDNVEISGPFNNYNHKNKYLSIIAFSKENSEIRNKNFNKNTSQILIFKITFKTTNNIISFINRTSIDFRK